MNNKKHICFISAGSISLNPRLVKEAILAAQEGYRVSVVGLGMKGSVSFDDKLLVENPSWETHIYPFVKKEPLCFFGTVFHHIARRIPNIAKHFEYGKMSIYTPSWIPLYQKMKSIKADIYVNHNIYLTPLVYKLAQKNNAKFGMDLEDAYAFITAEKLSDRNKLVTEIEKQYLPKADYLTAASPLYIDFYANLYQNLPTITPILNVFDDLEHTNKDYKDRKNTNNLSLYWFSQTTGKDRGIEQIIKALNLLDRKDIELHLRGNANENIKKYFLTIATTQNVKENIFFHELVSNQELAFRTEEHDVGLALELKESINRDLCLTNKIFQYMTSGLVILVSDTKAQQIIMKENPEIGFLIDITNTKKVAQKIEILANSKKNNTQELENMKTASKNLSKTKYNWNIEGQKFIQVLEDTLK